ncbi:MAG: cupin domain-containing protein [Dehalococcoidia bacterium]|nr:cupin domain-containing protein [Dehalococcoidia bacterium]
MIRAGERGADRSPTPGMERMAGIADVTCGAQRLWMGYVTVSPATESGAHHHGSNESGIFIIKGRARFYFGDHLEHTLDAGPGDFVHVPPRIVHVEANLSPDEAVEMIVARDSQEGTTVNVEVQRDDFKRRMWR